MGLHYLPGIYKLQNFLYLSETYIFPVPFGDCLEGSKECGMNKTCFDMTIDGSGKGHLQDLK